MDILIHFSSKHSHDLKLATLSYYTNRMIYLPPTQAEKQEMNMIMHNRSKQWIPKAYCSGLKKKLISKKEKEKSPVTETNTGQQNNNKGVTVTYYSSQV